MEQEKLKKVILKILVRLVIFIIAAVVVVTAGIHFMGGDFVLLIMPSAIIDVSARALVSSIRQLISTVKLTRGGIPVTGIVAERRKDAHIKYTVEGRDYFHTFGWSQGAFKEGDKAELLYCKDAPENAVVRRYELIEDVLCTAFLALMFAASAVGTVLFFLAMVGTIKLK